MYKKKFFSNVYKINVYKKYKKLSLKFNTKIYNLFILWVIQDNFILNKLIFFTISSIFFCLHWKKCMK